MDSQQEHEHSAKACSKESCSSSKTLSLLCKKDIFYSSNYSDTSCILCVDLNRSSLGIAPSYCIFHYRYRNRGGLIPSPLCILLCSRIFYIFYFKYSRFPFVTFYYIFIKTIKQYYFYFYFFNIEGLSTSKKNE